MKKSITVIALAAMMLFAFTACEQKMPSYQQVEYVTLAQTQDFIAGQALSADAFEVTVHYLDGSVATYPGTGRVSFTKGENTPATIAEEGVTANVTIAKDYSDSITVKYLEPEAITATVEVADVTKVYLSEGQTATRPSDPIKVTVTGATVTAGNVSWTLSAEELVSVEASTITLTAEEKTTAGTYTKETTVSYEDLEYVTTVTVNVVRNVNNPLDPDYVAPAKVTELDKDDVTKLGIVWAADVTSDDFDVDGTYDLDDIDTVAATTVTVGDTVEFTIVGIADDMTNKLPYVLQTADYKTVGTATIDDQPTEGSDVTGIKYDGADETTKALTATYQFVPGTTGAEGNYGKNYQITLTVTVEDKLSDSQTVTFNYNRYDNEGVWASADIDAAKGSVVIKASDFAADLTTVGKQTVTIKAAELYGIDKVSFTADELKELAKDSTTIVVNFSYSYDGGFGKLDGVSSVTINVVDTTESNS